MTLSDRVVGVGISYEPFDVARSWTALSVLGVSGAALLALGLGTGCTTATPDTLQRRFLSTGGTIINRGDTIIVRLDPRTYSPVLRSAGIPDIAVPW